MLFFVVATGILDVAGGADCNLVHRVLSIGSVSGSLGGDAVGCTLKAVASLFWMGTLGSDLGTDVASISRVRSRISCSCCAVTIGLHFRTLAKLDMAFMIFSACGNYGFVMFLCLKCTVSDNLSLWVDLMWQECVQ